MRNIGSRCYFIGFIDKGNPLFDILTHSCTINSWSHELFWNKRFEVIQKSFYPISSSQIVNDDSRDAWTRQHFWSRKRPYLVRRSLVLGFTEKEPGQLTLKHSLRRIDYTRKFKYKQYLYRKGCPSYQIKVNHRFIFDDYMDSPYGYRFLSRLFR